MGFIEESRHTLSVAWKEVQTFKVLRELLSKTDLKIRVYDDEFEELSREAKKAVQRW